MALLLVFGLTLFAAALISQLAERSVVSTAVLVLIVGALSGPLVFGISHFHAGTTIPAEVAELALFATLFTDGQRLSVREIRCDWRPATRALVIGLPLTVGGIALLGHWLSGLGWRQGLLLGAVLAPTDPVFAAAIVRRPAISARLRRLLNIESGVNDGLALPLVLVLLHPRSFTAGLNELVLPLGLGLAIGVSVIFLAHRIERLRVFAVHQEYRALTGFSLALVLYSLARFVGANEFLAAFAGGVTAISLRPELSPAFSSLVGNLADVLKFAGVFIMGGMLAPSDLGALALRDVAFVALVVVAVRPIALVFALFGRAARAQRVGGGRLVRAQGLRLRAVRDHGGAGRPARGAAPVHPGRAGDRRVHRGPFVDRRGPGPLAGGRGRQTRR
jgi:NhaP-type Na+/H+ or K+/H+ antiporter